MTDYRKYITIHPDQRSGQPCIRGRHGNGPGGEPHRVKGLRISVYDVLACLAFAADAEKRFQPNA